MYARITLRSKEEAAKAEQLQATKAARIAGLEKAAQVKSTADVCVYYGYMPRCANMNTWLGCGHGDGWTHSVDVCVHVYL